MRFDAIFKFNRRTNTFEKKRVNDSHRTDWQDYYLHTNEFKMIQKILKKAEDRQSYQERPFGRCSGCASMQDLNSIDELINSRKNKRNIGIAMTGRIACTQMNVINIKKTNEG